MIKLIRCDDRMIHGQCIVRVLGDFGIKRIIGVDNFTANNAILKRIYQLAVPPGIDGDIFTEEEAIKEIKAHLTSQETTLVLLKSPLSAVKLFNAIDNLRPELNIGPMSSRKETKKITMYAHLNQEERTALDSLSAKGVRVYFNQVIDQKSEEWLDIRNKM